MNGRNGSITAVGTEMRSYYGRPIVKEPVWTWEIPAYFFTGGLGGASSVLHGLARIAGHERLAVGCRRAPKLGNGFCDNHPYLSARILAAAIGRRCAIAHNAAQSAPVH